MATVLASCQREHEVRYEAPGGPVTIRVEAGGDDAAARAAVADYRFVAEVADAARPGPMGRTNQLLETTGEFSANPSLLPLIRRAKALSAASGGLFNPALGRLHRLWTSERAADAAPTAEAIAEILALAPTMDDIVIEGIRMRSRNAAVQLEFSDFAHAYALDAAADRLAQAGVSAGSVSNGRGTRLIGVHGPVPVTLPCPPAGTELRVALQAGEAVYTIALCEDRRALPALDPRTGHPVTRVRSVTVIASKAADAAAIATAAFVADAQTWRPLCARLGAKGALRVAHDGRPTYSPGMKSRMILKEPIR